MLEKYIKKAKEIHNHKYDYSKFIYINYHTKSTIICPIHGEFLYSIGKHLNSKYGCPKCGRVGQINHSKSNTADFIEKCKKVHGDLYDYSKTVYERNNHKILIICKKHGEFKQRASHHLCKHGCFTCGLDKQVLERTKSQMEILNQFQNTHGNIYDYTKVKYSNAFIKIIILCKKHGEFLQTPDHHVRGRGCPKCTIRISKGEIEFLNYLKIPDTNENRQKYITGFKVDGIDLNTNTIYEYLGDYYHGNPEKFNSDSYNKICHKTFGELYSQTFKRFDILNKNGYCIKYIWENDWNKFKKNMTNQPNIITY